ncbi:MAG: Ig-like domain-containing protein, partial [Bacteroidota bacterium]
YWSMAMLPPGADVTATSTAYEAHAMVFPQNTSTTWSYTASTGVVHTTFTVTPEVKEGSGSTVLLGLLPHHWAKLAPGSPQPGSYAYSTVRGPMKMLAANSFMVDNRFSGILPTLPNLAKYSAGFDPGALYKKIDLMKGDGLPEWTDSYNEGQNMNRLVQAAHIAHQIGYTAARDQLLNTVRTRLEDWFKAEGGEVAFLFYYNNTWKTMIGYPAGHRQDENLNDHHFHWGYFIHAAAAIEQYQPGWAAQWGGMVDLLIRDAANPSRTDPMFPFLRNFSPYAGHCWANGFATEPFGNDQESTSESMQFNSALIHWGTVTGNTQIRDLGIYLYTTEQSAVEEYWFDINDRTFQPAYAHEMVARVWGAGYDNGTWWTSDIAASYGIQLYPIHAGSLYLGHHTSYVQKVWDGMKAKTQVLSNTPNDNLWYDVYWAYLSFLDPQLAVDRYNSYTNRNLKVGISDAHTYHWLHTMNGMGQVMEEVTANYPIAAVFNKSGVKTYVAHNYSATAITVTYSDGFQLAVPARSTATNRDINVTVTLSSSAAQVPSNGTVTLTAATTGSGITKVDFYKDGVLIGSDGSAPYTVTTGTLAAGLPRFHARAYVGTNHNVSNIVTVQVGSQVAYGGTPASIPGTIQGGHYDAFEGGSGQSVSYSDATPWNDGGFRPAEAVDAASTPNEGNTVGWIDAGEWLEYTVNVATAGAYNVTIRYTSGNTSGGGPFWFESEDGTKISPDITVGFNDSNWSAYLDKLVQNVMLPAGQQVIRVKVGNGGFNLGRMTFVFAGGTPPAVSITSPSNNTSFNAPANITINATASDVDGTVSKVEFFNGATKLGEDTTSPYSFVWSNVASGSYTLTAKATDNANLTATSSGVNVLVNNNLPPSVSITAPANGASFTAPANITIDATATDNGSVAKVEFFNGATKLGEDLASPYTFNWANVAAGGYSLTAVATDNLGATTTSTAVSITVSGGGSGCSGNGPYAPGTSTPDYSWQATNTANPTVTFIPGSPIAGSTMAILYYKIGPGGYVGLIMDAAGSNFTKSFTAAAGANVSIYFTYRVGDTGIERNSSATPHNFIVAQCGGGGNVSPTVSITSPANGATFTAPANLTINANAADSDGTISKVEFFQGATLLGTDTSSPYSFAWNNVASGNYSITAKATDNANAVTTSSVVNITVNGGGGGVCTGTVANGDYSYEVSTTSGAVNWKFIPLAPIAGSTLCIINVKIGSGGYVGYTMTASGSNFTFGQSYAAGAALTFYFTYRVGTTMVERNSSATPHAYTVGATCSSGGRLSLGELDSDQDDESFRSLEFEMYPNPVAQTLTMKGVSGGFRIFDAQGIEVSSSATGAGAIDVSNLPPGAYTVIVFADKQKVIRRFIKE